MKNVVRFFLVLMMVLGVAGASAAATYNISGFNDGVSSICLTGDNNSVSLTFALSDDIDISDITAMTLIIGGDGIDTGPYYNEYVNLFVSGEALGTLGSYDNTRDILTTSLSEEKELSVTINLGVSDVYALLSAAGQTDAIEALGLDESDSGDWTVKITKALLQVTTTESSSVPVPASALLLATGIASLVGIRRRRGMKNRI